MTNTYKLCLLAGAASLLISACSNRHNSAGQYKNTGPQSGHYGQSHQAGQYYAQNSGHYAGYGQNYIQQGQMGYPQHNQYRQSRFNDYYGRPYGDVHGSPSQPQKNIGYRGSKFSYESLNAFEAPVAREFLGVTFEANGRLDSIAENSLENNTDSTHRLVGRHRIAAVKQLPNRYTIGATWTGIAEDLDFSSDPDYTGRIRGFIGGSWGTFHGGNIQNLVYEDTRRLRGAGRNVGSGIREENLAGDSAFGRLNDWAGGYQGRFGPTTISAVVDEDTNYDVGIKFQRPIGNKDYRLTARHNAGTFTAADGITEFETKAVSGVGEYVYGSTRYDIGAGYEQLESGAIDVDRWFTSAGVTHKRGVLSLTAEGSYGEIDGQDETSAFLGAKYDLARGLAATAAIDYQDRQINVAGVNIANTKDTRAIVGLSYGF